MEEAKKFGERLRKLHDQAGMTLTEVAGKCNIDFTYLSKIENGVLPPPAKRLSFSWRRPSRPIKMNYLPWPVLYPLI